MDSSTILSGLDSAVSQSAKATTTTTKTLGKDDFMKLLLAQLKNQDPLKPVDGTDFAAQLAQFSSLEQLSNMNAELKNQSLNQMTTTYAQSVNMIGKDVVTDSGNSLTVSGSTTGLTYELAKDAQSVTITILDKKGKVVKTWDETAQKAGMNKATWDTSDVEKGDYTFQVTAKDSQGQTVSVETKTSGLVTAVHFRNNQILATVNGKEVPLSSIIEVKQPEIPPEDIIDIKQTDILLSNIIEAIKLGKS
jgi:flagellar basal-body rod modification protein FlgD